MDNGGEAPSHPNDSPTDRCEECGEAIATNDWYPIAKERTPDGSLRLYPFCSEGCKISWLDDDSED